ncbi:MAG: hypothetical protein OES79_15080, partial [Planctomycetota bacterium]|nr:hypothetical protein [Planctomycetota bacterium]
MSTTTQTTTSTSDISSRLAGLRNLIRLYVLAQGVAVCISVLAVGFWLSLAVDWVFEPSSRIRGVVLVLLGLLLLYTVYHWLLRRLLVPLTDRSMAALLERRYRQLGDRLLTVVELSPRSPEVSGFDPAMLSNTRDEVLQMLPQAEVAPVMNFRPLLKAIGLAVLLVASVVSFMSWQTSAAKTWFDRSVLLGDAQWPRATRIIVEGFPRRDGRRMVKVAKGSSLTVKAKADTMLAIPTALQIRYETTEGNTGRPNMTMLKRAVPGRDEYQDFEYVFKNVQSDIVFDVVAIHGGVFGKNDRVRDLVIGAVDSPDLVDVVLQCKYPEYLNRPNEEFSVRLVQPLPEGTQVTIVGRANKDLVAANYSLLTEDPDAPQQTIPIAADDPRTIHVPLGPLATDTRVAFQLHDTDGVSNRQPIRTLIRIVADQPPQVDVSLAGIGKAVTPMAFLPMRGNIWDDHGLSRTWFAYQVDGKDPELRDFEVPTRDAADDLQELLFEVEDVAVTPGQKLSLLVKAADNYGLAGEPQVGTSQRYELQVVTEAQLRAILETRERILRRRFEGIIDEMTRTRDSLSRLVGQDPPDRSAGDDQPGDGESVDGPSPAGAEVAARSRAQRQLSRRILRTEQALQSSDRMRHETQEVADEFGRILLELENNNVSFFDEL